MVSFCWTIGLAAPWFWNVNRPLSWILGAFDRSIGETTFWFWSYYWLFWIWISLKFNNESSLSSSYLRAELCIIKASLLVNSLSSELISNYTYSSQQSNKKSSMKSWMSASLSFDYFLIYSFLPDSLFFIESWLLSFTSLFSIKAWESRILSCTSEEGLWLISNELFRLIYFVCFGYWMMILF